MRRVALLLVALFMMALMAGPAAAHVVTVTPPGNGGGTTGWVGPHPDNVGRALENTFAPGTPHFGNEHSAGGLNHACEGAERSGVADIRGPGGPSCEHGS
jgi:hypothetical protein